MDYYKILEVAKVMYSDRYDIDEYVEPWSECEFIDFHHKNGYYIGRIHVYQMVDIISEDLKNVNEKIIEKYLLQID